MPSTPGQELFELEDDQTADRRWRGYLIRQIRSRAADDVDALERELRVVDRRIALRALEIAVIWDRPRTRVP